MIYETNRVMSAIERELGQRKIIRSMGGPYESVIAADYDARLARAADAVIRLIEGGQHHQSEEEMSADEHAARVFAAAVRTAEAQLMDQAIKWPTTAYGLMAGRSAA